MVELLVITAGLLLALVFILKDKGKVPGIPMYPGELPIFGHLLCFWGDNTLFYRMIENISKESYKTGGHIGVTLGLSRFYVFTDPDDCATIMNASIEKHYVYSFAKPWLGDGMITAEPHIWQRNKKVILSMFHQRNLNSFLTVFNRQGRRLVRQFTPHLGKGSFNPEPYAGLIGLETICQTTMGLNIGEQTARNEKMVDAIYTAMECLVSRFKKVWLHIQPIFEVSREKENLIKHVNYINEVTLEMLQQRRQEIDSKIAEADCKDEQFTPMVDTMLKTGQNNKGFKDKQILDEINTLIVAGYDTTTNSLVFTLMLLGHHQDVQEKIYNELVEVLGDSDRDIDRYDLTKLVYLEAALKESLRLYPVIPMVARTVRTDVKLKNSTLPAGTHCVISILGLHRHPSWGVHAELFQPERWLHPETAPKTPNMFAPFGMGKRYCAGKTYAMMSLKTTVAHVIRNFRVKADISELVPQMLVLLKPASGHRITLEPRHI